MNTIHIALLSALSAVTPLVLSAQTIIPEQMSAIDPELESQILLEQTTETSEIAARYMNTAEPPYHVGVYQTFTWTGEQPLSGIGVLMAANANNLAGNSQTYALRVFEVSDLQVSEDPPTSITQPMLGDYEFTMTGDYRTVNDYLYFEFPDALALDNEGLYGFQIVTLGTGTHRRLTLATAQGGTKTYSDGYGYVEDFSNPDDLPQTLTGNGAINSLTFFATAEPIPEPDSAGLILGISMIGALCLFKRRRYN